MSSASWPPTRHCTGGCRADWLRVHTTDDPVALRIEVTDTRSERAPDTALPNVRLRTRNRARPAARRDAGRAVAGNRAVAPQDSVGGGHLAADRLRHIPNRIAVRPSRPPRPQRHQGLTCSLA